MLKAARSLARHVIALSPETTGVKRSFAAAAATSSASGASLVPRGSAGALSPRSPALSSDSAAIGVSAHRPRGFKLQAVAASAAATAVNLRKSLLPFAAAQMAKDPVETCLHRYVSADFINNVLDRARRALVPREPGQLPSRAGLQALVGYTSGGLDRHFAQCHAGHLGDSTLVRDMALLENAAAQAVLGLKKQPAPVVRRNVALDKTTLEAYAAGREVSFDRLTSVTLKPQQTYTGGNVDFVIHTRSGVVSLDALSVFSASKGGTRGEAEGLLDPGSHYMVVDVVTGKESGQASPDPDNFPAFTVHLKEV